MENFVEIIKIGMGDYSLHHLVWHLSIVAFCILTSGLFSVADTVSGIYTAKKTGEKLRSHRLRKMFEKMAVYWFFQVLVGIVGLILSLFPFYNLPYLSILFAIMICAAEGRSMWEHSRRRHDGVAKLPEAVQELIDLAGGEDELKRALLDMVRKRLGVENE
ncbi:MAG: phage holin family protein [Muribaculaceae bacterium]